MQLLNLLNLDRLLILIPLKEQKLLMKVYLSIPIRHREQARIIEFRLQEDGIIVLNPCNLQFVDCPKEEIPETVAKKCWEMIDESLAIILFVDYYGRDCAAEMGYSIAKNKPIFPFGFSEQSSQLSVDWMIKPYVEKISYDLAELAVKLKEKFPLR